MQTPPTRHPPDRHFTLSSMMRLSGGSSIPRTYLWKHRYKAKQPPLTTMPKIMKPAMKNAKTVISVGPPPPAPKAKPAPPAAAAITPRHSASPSRMEMTKQ